MAAKSPEALEKKREYHRIWAKANYAKRRAKHKERMANDPEYFAHQRELERIHNAKRRGRELNESPEARERRLQREREYNAKRARIKQAKKMAEALANPPIPKVEKKPVTLGRAREINKRKPGRIMALAGWRGY